MNIGTLTIEMAANVARLQKDMDSARRTVDGAMVSIQKSVDLARNAMIGLGAVMSVGAFSGLVKGSIASAAALNDLAIATGASVESLSALAAIGKYSDQSAESIAQAMNKLAKNMSGVTDEGKGAAAALKAIGLDFNNFNKLNPDEKMLALAKAMNEFQDGSGKSAVAMALLGREGAKMLPFMKDLAETGSLQAKVTTEQAAAADNFDDNMKKLRVSSSAWVKELSMGLIPSLDLMAQAMLDTFNKTGGLRDIIRRMAADGTLQAWAEGTFSALTYLADVLQIIGRVGIIAAKSIQGLLLALTGEFSKAAGVFAGISGDMNGLFNETLGSQLRTRMAELKAMGETAAAAKPKIDFTNVLDKNADALKALKKAEEELAKARIGVGKVEQKAIDTQVEATAKIFEGNQKLREEIDILNMTESARLKVAVAKEQELIATKELDLEMAKNAGQNTAIIAALEQEIELRKQRIGLLNEKDVAAANKKIRDDEIEAWKKTWDQVGQSFTDALMQGGKSVQEYLKSLFRTLVLRPTILPIVQGAMAAIGLGGTGPAAAAGGGTSTLQTVSAISSIKNAYTMITNSFTTLGDSVAFAAQDIGAWLQANTTGVLNEAGSSLMTNAGSIGTGASYLGGAAVGYGAGMMVSGKYSLVGNDPQTAVVIGTAIGAVIGGPIGAAIGGTLGGVVNRAFGRGARETRAYGITGTFTAGGAKILTFQDWIEEGGWFRSDKTGRATDAVGKELQTAIDTALGMGAAATTKYVESLGMSAEAVKTFSQAIELNLKDLTPEEQQKKIAEALSNFSEAMVAAVAPGLAEFQRSGELMGDTLVRLSNSLTTVNGTFGNLGMRLLDVSMAGAAAASTLVDMLGGIDAFNQSTNYFYENFYTEAEKTALIASKLAEAFGSMNLALPATKEGFVALVKSLDVTTASGAATFATLMNLAPAFNSLNAKMVEDATAATNKAFAGVQRAIQSASAAAEKAITTTYNALNKALQTQRDSATITQQVASDNYDQAKSLFDMIHGQLSDLLGGGMTAAQGSEFLTNAIASGKATGYLPSQDELSKAISAARSGTDAANFTTAFEMRRSQMLLVDQLTALEDVAGEQFTTAEKQLKAAEEQLARIDYQIEQARTQYETDLASNKAYYEQQLAYAQAQVDTLRGVDTSIKSVAAAMNDLAAAIRSEASLSATKAASVAASQPYSISDTAAERAAKVQAQTGVSVSSSDSALVQAAKVLYQSTHGGASTAEYNAAAAAVGGNIGAALGWDGSMAGTETLRSIYGFADGGFHNGGLRIVGEHGPELEATGPARYWSNSQTSALMQGGDVAAEIRALRDEVTELRYEARATASNTSKMAKLQDNWDVRGLTVKTDADQPLVTVAA